MKTALIAMTLMGCDDTVTDCRYVATVDEVFETVEACDARTEWYLNRVSDMPYPVAVAVCEAKADPGDDIAEANAMPLVEEPQAPAAPESTSQPVASHGGLSGALLYGRKAVSGASWGAGWLADAVLPDVETVRAAGAKPVHVVTDAYAWVLKRVAGD